MSIDRPAEAGPGAALRVACSACGATVDPLAAEPFRCPAVGTDKGDVDHILECMPTGPAPVFPPPVADLGRENPFWRYRAFVPAYRIARALGLDDATYAAVVDRFDRAVAAVDGRPMRCTPVRAIAAGPGRLWLKDETGSVGRSHKVRHLYGVMLYLLVMAEAGGPGWAGLRDRRLGIASCGNAATAAAILARAADWPIDVFVPAEAAPGVLARLEALGATLRLCRRSAGQAGDPCAHALRAAVDSGTLPFTVQGPENGLAVTGVETLAFELAEQLWAHGEQPAWLALQVGGGALASGCWRGFARLRDLGIISNLPGLLVAQGRGCHPLLRAWRQMQADVGAGAESDAVLAAAARRRSRYMVPWSGLPAGVASGILDDETYDWRGILRGLVHSGGMMAVLEDADIVAARDWVRAATGIEVSHTGAAGVAAVQQRASHRSGAAVAVLTGHGTG